MAVEGKRHAGTGDEVRRMQVGGRKERRESWWRERSKAGTGARGKRVLIMGRRESWWRERSDAGTGARGQSLGGGKEVMLVRC